MLIYVLIYIRYVLICIHAKRDRVQIAQMTLVWYLLTILQT